MTVTQPATSALAGIRVLDFSQMMLGPFATQLLGDLGADVIKIERPGHGEWERSLQMGGRLHNGVSAAFLAMNRNKRSVAADLKSPIVRSALLELARSCDVVVENFRPGVMERLGLGYEDFKAMREDIIYCSGSGWGQHTRYARENRPGQDLLIQAMTGLAANAGRSGEEPVVAGSSISDAVTALTLANGILAALVARDRTGIGQRVEVDLFHSTISVMCQEIAAMVNQEQEYERSKTGIAQPWLSAPYGIYQVADGSVAIAMGSLAALGTALGADFTTFDPWHDRDAIKRLVDDLVLHRTTNELIEALHDAGLWAAATRTMKEAVDELRADGSPLLVELDMSDGEPVELIGCPITFSRTPWSVHRRPPLVGEHTREIMTEVLDDDTIDQLTAEGVLG